MAYKDIKVPAGGAKITKAGGKLQVPDNPIIPFVEGDGTGRDIWRASVRVFDAAVEKAYKGKRRIHWMEVYAGEKAFKRFKAWLPDETTEAFKEFVVGIKGPLTTPIGGGIRSLNVALRKVLDLYVCQRPIQYFAGVPSPVKHPEYVNMVIFRENTEDIYAGMEFAQGTEDNVKFKALLKETFPAEYAKMRFPNTSGIGLKPVSQEGTERVVRGGHPVGTGEQAPQHQPDAQGQHHEVHRGGVQGLGLRAGQAGVPQRHRDRARDLDPGQPGEGPDPEPGSECAHGRPGLRHDVAGAAGGASRPRWRRRSSCCPRTARASGSPSC